MRGIVFYDTGFARIKLFQAGAEGNSCFKDWNTVSALSFKLNMTFFFSQLVMRDTIDKFFLLNQ